jgi:hypothetical protein
MQRGDIFRKDVTSILKVYFLQQQGDNRFEKNNLAYFTPKGYIIKLKKSIATPFRAWKNNSYYKYGFSQNTCLAKAIW